MSSKIDQVHGAGSWADMISAHQAASVLSILPTSQSKLYAKSPSCKGLWRLHTTGNLGTESLCNDTRYPFFRVGPLMLNAHRNKASFDLQRTINTVRSWENSWPALPSAREP